MQGAITIYQSNNYFLVLSYGMSLVFSGIWVEEHYIWTEPWSKTSIQNKSSSFSFCCVSVSV